MSYLYGITCQTSNIICMLLYEVVNHVSIHGIMKINCLKYVQFAGAYSETSVLKGLDNLGNFLIKAATIINNNFSSDSDSDLVHY